HTVRDRLAIRQGCLLRETLKRDREGFEGAASGALRAPCERVVGLMERRPIWRRDAVRAQIEAAIALFAQGKPIPSLSLAGAAEEATPATNEPYVFEKAKQVGPERGYGTAQEVGQRLNETRN